MPNQPSPSLLWAVQGRTWFMFSMFLRPAKHIPLKEWRAEEVVSWLVQFLISFQPPQHSWCVSQHWVGLGWEGERGTNKEKSHMQGYTFLKNSFLCLLLSKQSKRKVIEKKPHCDTETKKTQPRISFLEQNKLQENAVFNVNVQLPILLSPVWANPGLSTELSPAPHTGAGEGSCQ